MDEKTDIKMGEARVHKSKLVGGSMLLLSLLLTATVASLIYLAVVNSQDSCVEKKQVEDIDLQANVHVKTDESDVNAKIQYSKGGHVAYYYGDDGSFNMDDFRKGIHVARPESNGVCLIIAVGTNKTNEQSISRFITEWDGKEESAEVVYVDFNILDGKLRDTSFLTEKAHEECTSGFQWMSVVPVDETVKSELERTKRSSCYRRCYYIYLYGRLYYYCRYKCYG